MDRINKILTMADDALISHEASALLSKVKQELDLHAQQLDKLHTLSHLFFNTLKKVGDLAGVPLPEPSALELMDLTSINLLGMLDAYAQIKEVDESETDCFSTMNVHNAVTHLNQLLRVQPQAGLAFSFEQPNAEQIDTMLRKRKQTMEVSLTSQPSTHLIHLLRKQDTTKYTNLSSI
jgi:hypothetical protein